MLRRKLARTLFALAAASAAVTGCKSRDARPAAVMEQKEAETATLQGETVSKEESLDKGDRMAARKVAGVSVGSGSGVAMGSSRGSSSGRVAPAVPHDTEAYQNYGVNAW